MPSTNDTDEYESRWKGYIDEVKTIGLALPPEKIDELDDHMEGLKDLVDDAVENMDD